MTENTLPPAMPLDRRQFLRLAGAAALTAAGSGPLLSFQAAPGGLKAAWEEEPKGPYAPFRMGLQGYTFREFDFEKTVETLYELHIQYMEIWEGHFPLDSGEFDFKKRLKSMRHNMVRKIAYGVVSLGKSAGEDRDIFEFAKKLRLYALTANPEPACLPSLDKLIEEYHIAVGIHNHGPEDRNYGRLEPLKKALDGRHKNLGLCIDTGHFLRAGVNPVEVAREFKGRIFSVHLKDVKTEGGKSRYTILGQGDLDLVGFLKALKEGGFKGPLALEYEEEPENPIESVKKCLQAVQEAVKKIN